jgi:S1-C subfamily serine protease
VRLSAGELCPQCESTRAWERYGRGGGRLVIDRQDIADAEARLEGSRPRFSARAGTWLLALAATAVALVAALVASELFRARPLGPLGPLQAELLRSSRLSTGLGALGLFAGLVSLMLQRGGPFFRSVPLLVVNLSAILVGSTGAFVGAANWIGVGSFDWLHRAMPAVPEAIDLTPPERSIVNATAVLIAPDANGDLRGASIGSGAIIRSTLTRAFIVTCSHVVMPYASVAAQRDPARAHPVWAYFSDGREAEGRVVWTAEPPLDVAVVRVELADPPAPVPVLTSADSAEEGFAVSFVPNPFRSGWMVHRGNVLKRESHRTPAGVYSLIYTSLPVQPGDSGTGLFDGLGRLIGLNTWTRFDEGGPRGISLPSNTMERIMAIMDENQLVFLEGLDEGGGNR